MKIIGRKHEQAELKHYYNSGRPEFIAITGRRRVGKTYLIKEYFSDDIVFYFSGMIGANVSNNYQLKEFNIAISEYGGDTGGASNCWSDAFRKLKELVCDSDKGRKVIFIDELPWLDAPKSDFMPALDKFWNTFASSRPDVMLIVCGSAASWIVNNIFKNRGGLHNRITGRFYLAPFTLGECEDFIKEAGIVMNRYQIAEIYMILGGIPYYLNMLMKNLSPTQNVDHLFFSDNAPLKSEFDEVFHSLFRTCEKHVAIIEALSVTSSGHTRDDIISCTGIKSGGSLTKTLQELEQCGFIEKYADFTKNKKNAFYRLIDPFALFWLRYVKNNNSKDRYYWTNLIDDGGRRAWSGYAFELICLLHIEQIKHKLGISGISTDVFSWKSRQTKPGAQIDLIIARKDGVINLCEMKFSLHPFEVTANYDEGLQRKKMAFLSETGTHKAIHITMVTTFGLEERGYRASVQSEVSLDDLFLQV